MADIKELSPKLKDYKDAYDGSGGLSSVESAKSEMATNLTSAANKVSEAISSFTSAGNDSTIKSLISDTTLAKDGLERVKSHVEGDLSALLGNASELRNLITKIEDLIKESEGFDSSISDKQTKISGLTYTSGDAASKKSYDDAKSALEGEINTLVAKINDNNLLIEDQNKKGETQLDAMSAAINGVSMGVVGNMRQGGVLGNSTLYSDNYSFSWTDYQPQGDNPTEPENTRKLSCFKDANEFDEVELDAHKGASNVVCIPRNMREMKDAIKNGQPFIIEKGSIFQYDPGGAGFNYYDATNGRKYFIKCDDGYYREVDENGNLVNDKNQRIDPKRIQEAGDYSTQTGWGFWWTNDTGLKYSGEQREKAAPAQTGSERTNIAKASEGDSFVGKMPNGTDIHKGESTIVSFPKNMVELKEAMSNGQPVVLSGVRLNYDHGRWYAIRIYDGTTKPVYLVQDENKNYRQVDENGNYVNGGAIISPTRIFEAGDSTKPNWWVNAPWHMGTNDTSMEAFE